MWKPVIAKNLHLSNLSSAKKGRNQERSLRLETLETRTMFYADPLTLSVPDTPLLVGEANPTGPKPENFLQQRFSKATSQTIPPQIDMSVPQNTPTKINASPTTTSCSHGEDPLHRIAMCRHLSEFSRTGPFARFIQK
jgi:hypothetical protein